MLEDATAKPARTEQRLHLLLLGGTTEALRLAHTLAAHADLTVTYSLRGATRTPAAVPCRVRRGGFGGIAGLQEFMRAQRVDAVVDATHPYAQQMSTHAMQACAALSTPRLVLTRPPWEAQPGDRWIPVASSGVAAELAEDRGARVLVTLGSSDLAPWAATRQVTGLVRCIEAPGVDLPRERLRVIRARGPFALVDELRLLREAGIDLLVTKNSGGEATYAKITAARQIGIDVAMLERPVAPGGLRVHTEASACAWLARLVATGAERGGPYPRHAGGAAVEDRE